MPFGVPFIGSSYPMNMTPSSGRFDFILEMMDSVSLISTSETFGLSLRILSEKP